MSEYEIYEIDETNFVMTSSNNNKNNVSSTETTSTESISTSNPTTNNSNIPINESFDTLRTDIDSVDVVSNDVVSVNVDSVDADSNDADSNDVEQNITEPKQVSAEIATTTVDIKQEVSEAGQAITIASTDVAIATITMSDAINKPTPTSIISATAAIAAVIKSTNDAVTQTEDVINYVADYMDDGEINNSVDKKSPTYLKYIGLSIGVGVLGIIGFALYRSKKTT